jgi:preprotein translocase subunit SecE
MAEKIKIAVAALIAAGGLFGFYALGESAMIVRIGALFGALAVAAALMWFTQAGRDFVQFTREASDEAKRVVWPSRKETLQTTGVVFLFVFTMALILWIVDAGLLMLTQKLLGQGG